MSRVWRESLDGMTFGRLFVVGEADRVNGRRRWCCKCSCGQIVSVEHRALKGGFTKSCGCLRREETAKAMTKHGHAKRNYRSRVYKIWSGMLSRCETESASGFDKYGGSGIAVCKRWHEFEHFYADMGDPPSGYSIDRIDSTKGYEPGNCRWADRQKQNENRRSVRWIEFDGKRMNAKQWADYLGINKSTLLEALKKHPIEVALRERTR